MIAILLALALMAPADDAAWTEVRAALLADPKFAAARQALLERPAEAKAALAAVSADRRGGATLLLATDLAQRERLDDALALLAPLKPEDVPAPAALLFTRAVCRQQLGQPAAALADLDALAKLPETPRRYRIVGAQLRAELAARRPEALGGIAHDMGEVRRRLSLGQPDDRTRELEKDILKRLDKTIDELEKKCKQKLVAAGKGGKHAKPLDRSMALPGEAEGKVDEKARGLLKAWGNLPPKEREKALQDLARDYPVHYRSAIEEYFRRLATAPAEAAP